MREPIHPTSNEYLGLDRDELRGVIRERDTTIERLRAVLKGALEAWDFMHGHPTVYIRVNEQILAARKALSGDSSAPETTATEMTRYHVGLKLQPAAWMRGVSSHVPGEPSEYDWEVAVDCDGPPDDSGKWIPLYRAVEQPCAQETPENRESLPPVGEPIGANRPAHSVEDDFQHWLSYSGSRFKADQATCAWLRSAYFAGAGAEKAPAYDPTLGPPPRPKVPNAERCLSERCPKCDTLMNNWPGQLTKCRKCLHEWYMGSSPKRHEPMPVCGGSVHTKNVEKLKELTQTQPGEPTS